MEDKNSKLSNVLFVLLVLVALYFFFNRTHDNVVIVPVGTPEITYPTPVAVYPTITPPVWLDKLDPIELIQTAQPHPPEWLPDRPNAIEIIQTAQPPKCHPPMICP